jgi:hypothetical protein
MSAHLEPPLCFCLIGAVLAGSVACVEPFGGSNVQVSFYEGVPAPAPEGTTPAFGTPPAGTFLSFYAVDFVYARDASGAIVRDAQGNPVIADSFVFRFQDFEIRPVIDTSSPCFIEVDNTRFPGLHVTRLADKLGEITGIEDPRNPEPGDDPGDVSDLLDAQRRLGFLGAIQNQVKAVTSTSTFRYPAPGTACVEDGGSPSELPPIACTGDRSNEVRLELCRQLWQDNPSFYEGNDKVFTLPLNGEWFGTVHGTNPVNSSSVGGAGFYVDAVLSGIDSLLVNWQYKDFDGDGEPDYPDGFPEAEKSDIGYLFMAGTPVDKTRGVINIPLDNPGVFTIRGEAVIFADLGRDSVHF